jgi:hypothetical protein
VGSVQADFGAFAPVALALPELNALDHSPLARQIGKGDSSGSTRAQRCGGTSACFPILGVSGNTGKGGRLGLRCGESRG